MAAILLMSGCQTATLAESLDKQTIKTAKYVKDAVPAPGVASVRGEWAVKGIAESGLDVEQSYFDVYYDNVRAMVKSSDGKLKGEYNSDYARLIIGLCAIGKEDFQIEGYDITRPLEEYEAITTQGANAVSYTLAAANTAGIVLEHEQDYVDFLVAKMQEMLAQEKAGYTDYIAMSLLGLSFYQEQEEVKVVMEQGIQYLSDSQKENGSMGSCESTAETIVALSQLGIDVFQDKRFVKEKGNLGESLMMYCMDNGAFAHTEEDKQENMIATEKALLALCSMQKYEKGEKLYEKK